jgi:hypothetical protein
MTPPSREAEAYFFQTHGSFCTCDPKVLGVQQLSKKLSALLVARIQLQLAPMKAHAEKSLGTPLIPTDLISPDLC